MKSYYRNEHLKLSRRQCLGLGALSIVVSANKRAWTYEEPAFRWDQDDIVERVTLKQPGRVWATAFSPDSRLVAAGGFQEKGVAPSWITLWDAENWTKTQAIKVEGARIVKVAFAPGGNDLVAAGLEDGYLVACDPKANKVQTIFRHSRGGRSDFGFSPDGRYMITSNNEGLMIWEVGSWRRLREIPHTRDQGLELAVEPSQVWNIFGGQVFALNGAGIVSRIEGVSSLPPGKLATPANGGFPEWGLRRVPGIVRPWGAKHLAVDRDGLTVAFCGYEEEKSGYIDVYNTSDDGRWHRRVDIPLGDQIANLHTLAFTPDGLAIVAGCADGIVRRWDSTNGRKLPSWQGHQGNVMSLAASADGSMMASAGGNDKSVKVWSPRAAMRR